MLTVLLHDTAKLLKAAPKVGQVEIQRVLGILDAIDDGWQAVYKDINDAKATDYADAIKHVNKELFNIWHHAIVRKWMDRCRAIIKKVYNERKSIP